MRNLSVIREAEYKALQVVSLDGLILDVGGGKKSEYQDLLKGSHTFFSINIDVNAKPDAVVDIEYPFPLQDKTYDHAICMNVLEHVFEFENVISETARVLKDGGNIVLATPMIYKIHGSPDDYLRYTQSALCRVAKKHNLTVVSITPLGFGFFSTGVQFLRAAIPAGFVWICCKRIAMTLDLVCNTLIPGYATLTKQIPLGYVTILQKAKQHTV
jgi:SAM-dependent methyltransferase